MGNRFNLSQCGLNILLILLSFGLINCNGQIAPKVSDGEILISDESTELIEQQHLESLDGEASTFLRAAPPSSGDLLEGPILTDPSDPEPSGDTVVVNGEEIEVEEYQDTQSVGFSDIYKFIGNRVQFDEPYGHACRRAGSAWDRRSRNKQYTCNELPFGKTNRGIRPGSRVISYLTVVPMIMSRCITPPRHVQTKEEDYWTEPRISSSTIYYSGASFRCKSALYNKLISPRRLIQTATKGRDAIWAPAVYKITLRPSYVWSRIDAAIRVWRSQKTLVSVPVNYRDKKKRRYYTFKFYSQRSQRSSTSDLKSLINTRLKVPVHRDPMKNFNLSLKVSNGKLYANICHYIPGFRMWSPEVRIKYTYIDNWLFSASVRGKVTLGQFEFDNLKTCALVRVNFDYNNMRFNTELRSISVPKFKNARISGVDVDIDSVGSLLNTFLPFLDRMISREIEKAVKEEVDKYVSDLNTKIRRGTWVKEILEEKLDVRIMDDIDRFTTALNGDTSNSIRWTGVSLGLCDNLISTIRSNPDVTSNLAAIGFDVQKLVNDCLVINNNFQFSNIIGADSTACYDAYVNIADFKRSKSSGATYWWEPNNVCHIGLGIRTLIPKRFRNLARCLGRLNVIANGEILDPNLIYQNLLSCHNELSEY